MKVVRVNGRASKVFVLKETDESLVYIPLSSIQRVDYTRLLEIEKRGGDMLNEMRKTKLDNGINALTQYDDVIQVMHYKPSKKDTGIRVPKPDEGQNVHLRYEKQAEDLEKEKEKHQESQKQEQTEGEDKPKKRGPGRPRKNPQPDDATES